MDTQSLLTCLSGKMDEIRHRFLVRRLSIFGSAARGQAGGASDVDVMVSFEKAATFDLFMDLKFYLEELLGTKVDLVTDRALRPRVRRAIQSELIDVA